MTHHTWPACTWGEERKCVMRYRVSAQTSTQGLRSTFNIDHTNHTHFQVRRINDEVEVIQGMFSHSGIVVSEAEGLVTERILEQKPVRFVGQFFSDFVDDRSPIVVGQPFDLLQVFPNGFAKLDEVRHATAS